MSDFFSSEMVEGVLAALIVILILWIFGWLKFKRDEKIVARFLENAGVETPQACRTTNAIASGTNLSEARIRKVCRNSTRVRRNRKEKESWRLS